MTHYTTAQRNGEPWAQPKPQYIAPFKPFVSCATCLIEVGSPRNGRPGYRWVQGWQVNYGPGRVSIPMRRSEAYSLLREINRLAQRIGASYVAADIKRTAATIAALSGER